MYQRLLADARLLEECGCTVIAIPCNTSHYFVDRIQQEIGIPILHMIRETARTLVAQGKRRPAILATDGTIRTGLYQKECAAFGLEAAPPEPLSSVWSCPSSTRRSNGGSGAAGRNLPRSTALWLHGL